MRLFSIAIDGPSGAGKSTIAKIIAKDLDIIYLDTGALYRAIGLYVFNKGIDPTDANRVIPLLNEINIEIIPQKDGQRVILNKQDVTTDIRKHEISKYASDVSAIPKVREFLLDLQRNFAKKHSVIMDGRDIGTVILPNADVKIFLTASPEDRAKRRFKELIERGQKIEYDNVLKDILERDYNDSNRAVAPLKPADDAIIIDTTGFELADSVKLIKNTIRERLGNAL